MQVLFEGHGSDSESEDIVYSKGNFQFAVQLCLHQCEGLKQSKLHGSSNPRWTM